MKCFKKRIKYIPTKNTPVEDVISMYSLYIQLKENSTT